MLVYPISNQEQLQFVGTPARPLCASARAVCRLPPCRLRVGNVQPIACEATGGRAEDPPRTRAEMLINI